MKLLLGIIFAVLCMKVQADPETVAAFREAIEERYTRNQAFYDATNNAMRLYRLAHVDEVTETFNQKMPIFANDIMYVRESRAYVNRVISDVLAELGGQPNACLNSVLQRLVANSQTLGEEMNHCSQRANTTMFIQLDEVFYPTFQDIQGSVSPVQLLVMDGLSRGNVFDDNQEIIDYLQSQYDVMVMQWLGAVSQLFRWETVRFDVEGNFYTEEMEVCAQDAIYQYSLLNTVLMYEAYDQCRP